MPQRRRRHAVPDDLRGLADGLKPLASPVRLALLRFITEPRYLEEIASHLGLTRQAARRHVGILVDAGIVERRAGTRETGAVVEFTLTPHALFKVNEELEQLAGLRTQRADMMHRTAPGVGAGLGATGLDAAPSLVIVRGPRWGDRIPLGAAGRGCVIGRDDRCDIVLAYDPYASNRHAEVRPSAGGFMLADLRSTNGTTLNLVTLPQGGEAMLHHGDLVCVGRTLLLFWERRPKDDVG